MHSHSHSVGIRTCSDYSPFGVELDGRTVSGGYRFGFQGSEKDNEFKGDGNSYTTEFRQLDPRLGRWLSVDPLVLKYPDFSPYNFCKNSPIIFVDPDGRENIPALMWALNNMVNEGIISDYSNPWYDNGSEGGWVFQQGVVPTRIVCYESCWISYMNGASSTTLKTFKSTGFSSPSGGFKGRSSDLGGENWFKSGTGTNGRQFVKDITKGQLGDIMFMGEAAGMHGHAVMLASEIISESVEVDGKMVNQVRFKALSTSSDSEPLCYGVREFTFQKNDDGTYSQVGDAQYKFRGIGQMTNINSTEEARRKAISLVQEKSIIQKNDENTNEGSGSDGSIMEEDFE